MMPLLSYFWGTRIIKRQCNYRRVLKPRARSDRGFKYYCSLRPHWVACIQQYTRTRGRVFGTQTYCMKVPLFYPRGTTVLAAAENVRIYSPANLYQYQSMLLTAVIEYLEPAHGYTACRRMHTIRIRANGLSYNIFFSSNSYINELCSNPIPVLYMK